LADSPATFLPVRRFGATTRRDTWWAQPLVTFIVFSAFVVYVTWALLQGTNYWSGNLLSPLYSPELFGGSPHAIFGPPPPWLLRLFPAPLTYSPAMLILVFPLAFRMTCYYYRGAYYKAFWADPPNCAVGEPRKSYLGERYFPLVIQNVHRYALYFALIFIFILASDVWKALWFAGPGGAVQFGVSLGTIVLLANVVLIACYTLGCHSLRHLAGGVLDVMSGRPMRKTAYACVSCFNRWHMKWAWISLVWVGFTDIYVRLCAMGVWHDVRLF
jgi:hypothetical protein